MRRGGSGSDYADGADTLSTASTCKEAVELIVDAIQTACEDIGNMHDQGQFVVDKDVVGCVISLLLVIALPSLTVLGHRLLEAERTTTMYAKMEYGVKRLLWLGAS